MEYKALALDAWRLTRHGRPLWWLGLVSAASALMYSLIVLAMTGPLAILPQLVVTPGTYATGVGAGVDEWRVRAVGRLSQTISAHGFSILAGITVVYVVWIVLGVFDVASQTGLITQAYAAERLQAPSFRVGMRDGFRVWWRVVGLLALSVLPSLVAMLGVGLVMLFTVSLPLLRGETPDPSAVLLGNAMLSPLSAITTLVGIPVGLTVQLGMRNAVLADEDWKASFSAGWKLLAGNFMEVALVYLLVAGVGLIVGIVAGIVISVVGGIAAVVVVSEVLTGGAGGGVVLTLVAAFAVLSLLLVPLTAVTYVWNSCVWTLYWTRKTGSSSLGATMVDSA